MLALNPTYFNEVTDAYYMLALCYWYDWKWNGEISREYLMKVIVRNPNFQVAYLMLAEQMIDEHKKQTWLKISEIADNSNMVFVH